MFGDNRSIPVRGVHGRVDLALRVPGVFPGRLRLSINDPVDRGKQILGPATRMDPSRERGICFNTALVCIRAAGRWPRASAGAILRAATSRGKQRATAAGASTAANLTQAKFIEGSKAVMTHGSARPGGGALGSVGGAARRRSDRQAKADGSYSPKRIAGMFNKTCAIHYTTTKGLFRSALGEPPARRAAASAALRQG